MAWLDSSPSVANTPEGAFTLPLGPRLAAVAVAAATLAFCPAAGAAAPAAPHAMSLQAVGTSSFEATVTPGAAAGGSSVAPVTEPGLASAPPASPAGAPYPAPLPVVTDAPAPGFLGLTHLDQRLLDGGNQLDLEPGHPALCVGNGFVVQAVNTAVAVYGTDGSLRAAQSLNRFLTLPSAAIRDQPPTGDVRSFGPLVRDPQCVYDSLGGRFVLTALEADTDPATGFLAGRSAVMVAVSQSGDPTLGWSVFRVGTTNDGADGEPVAHPGCPCVGARPRLGLDANGVYITTDEYTLATASFQGAQLYALSRSLLEAAALDPTVSVPVAHLDGLTLGTGMAAGVQPAVIPPGGTTLTAFRGTALFLADAGVHTPTAPQDPNLQTRLAMWSVRRTETLTSMTPDLRLHVEILRCQPWGQPPLANQPDGPRPLADFLSQTFGVPVPVGPIQPGDASVAALVFAAGRLYAAANTAIANDVGRERVGVAWWVIDPHVPYGGPATMAEQGYVSIERGSVLHPSLAVRADGTGAMGLTLVKGLGAFYPSAAYVRFGTAPPDTVHVAAAGAAPQDGYSEYGGYFGSPPRFGDGAAAVDADGSLWLSQQYIPDAPRVLLANWGTFVTHLPAS